MGLIKIRRSESKLNVQLNGDFDIENIDWIMHVMKKRGFFFYKVFEFDMYEVETISSKALSQLFIVLQLLQEREIKTNLKGLDPTNLPLNT